MPEGLRTLARSYRSGSQRRSVGVACFALTLLYALVLHPVWSPSFIAVDVDLSWHAVLHHAWLEGWQFGTEIVYTGGPYYFLHTRLYYPGTYPLLVALTLGTVCVSVWAMWRLVRAGTRDGVLGAGLVLLVLEVTQHSSDLAGFVPPALFVLLSCLPPPAPSEGAEDGDELGDRLERLHPALLHALALVLALLSLTKYSMLAASLVAVATVCADTALRRRQLPRWALTYGTGLVALWLLAGQSLGGIPEFIRSTYHIMAGYTEAMSVRASPYAEVLACWAALGVALPWLGLHLWARRRWWSLLPIGGCAILFVAVAKGAFVRDGDRGHVPAGLIACLALLMAPAILARLRVAPAFRAPEGTLRKRARAAAFITVVVILGATNSVTPRALNVLERVAAIPQRVQAVARSLWDPGHLNATHEERLARVRAVRPLPMLEGTVDIYAPFQAVILAHGLDYQARPIFQSFQAYTPTLEGWNRDHLLGDRAPDQIVLSLIPADNRYPSLANGKAWPELLSRYHASRELAPGWSLLSKSDPARSFTLTLLSEVESGWARPIDVPRVAEGSAVWVEMEIERSLRGQLLSLLYKAPRLWLVPRSEGDRGFDQPKVYRLIAGMARSGFLLSPRIESSVDFKHLTDSTSGLFWAERRVSSIELRIARDFGESWAYTDSVKLRFYELAFER